MLDLMYKTEQAYTKCFAQSKEDGSVIRFWDDRLTDMHCHNFTLIRDNLGQTELIELIRQEIDLRRGDGNGFLQVETNFAIDEEVMQALPIKPEVTVLDYMAIPTREYINLPDRENTSVKKAIDRQILQDAVAADTESNAPAMGEFAHRRAARKAEVYGDSGNPVHVYVCYFNGKPIGKCELLLGDGIAKIEDFDIMEVYQRKGFGTAVLKQLLQDANKAGVDMSYLITDSEDTAKDMYSKCGFKKYGQKTQLFFRFL